MKITYKQLLDFVNELPTNLDYHTLDYGRITMEQDDMTDRLLEFLKTIDPEFEVVDERTTEGPKDS